MNDLNRVGALNLTGFRPVLFWITVFNDVLRHIYSYLHSVLMIFGDCMIGDLHAKLSHRKENMVTLYYDIYYIYCII